MITGRLTSYGKLSANFVIATELIPKESLIALWALLASILTGWFVPNIARWINGRRQSGELSRILTDIDTISYGEPTNQDEVQQILDQLRLKKKEVSAMLTERKITESQFNILDKRISDFENKINKSKK